MTSVIKYYEGIDSVAVIGNYLPIWPKRLGGERREGKCIKKLWSH
jgi:hypothetical protein